MELTDWRRSCASKLATAKEAIRLIPPGRRILIGSGAAQPLSLVHSLVADGFHLADNEIVHMLTLGPAPYVAPELKDRFRHIAFFIGPNVRDAVQEGRADFMPVFLSDIPKLIRSRRVRIDVALIQISPPDRHGFASLGVSVDIVRAAVDTAQLIIAEVNPLMPRTLGDSFIHVDRIDRLIPIESPLPESESDPTDEVVQEIGHYVANLIPDGATLQAGIGAIPHAVLSALKGRKDLGVHTEMLSDGMMQLAQEGVITGRKKTLLPGKMVTSFVMGSRKLYEWVHDNPAIEMRPTEFTNDPDNIERNARMMAINSALAVDLTGQVTSDTVMGRFYSGIGGQVDFIRGASRSQGGKAIIALRSTARDGTVSRIQPELEPGAGVVTSRGDVHYVVTEYGVADLWGKSVRERAKSLISIAHPKFRAELMEAAKRQHFVFPDQVIPRSIYAWKEERVEALPSDGGQIMLRPARITDERPLQEFFYCLSDESVYKRFLAFKREHPHEEMQQLVDFDYEANLAIVACTLDHPEEIVGVIRYDVDPATKLADIAFTVADRWQGRGVGTLMMKRMKEIAFARGLAGFTADVLATNTRALAMFHESGVRFRAELSAGVYHLVGYFDNLRRS
jgi:acyl-CoA hydrolase/RimJ/RimL family protein N-acetyltransferase